MELSILLTSFVLFVVAVSLFYAHKNSRGPAALPPGPKPLPFIGNLLDVPKEYEWLHWAKHKDIYGPISMVSVLGKNIVIINDFQLAVDILNKRSTIYSDRPTFTFSTKLVGWENGMAAMRSGLRQKEYRKKAMHVLGTRAALNKFSGIQEIEARRLLYKIARDGEGGLEAAVKAMVGAVILRIAYGYKIDQIHADPLVGFADLVMDEFSQSVRPGAWLVDVLPWLRFIPAWFPGAGFQRTAQKWRRNAIESVEKPYAFVLQQMSKGTAELSYTSTLLEKLRQEQSRKTPQDITEEEFVIKWSSNSLYGAGSDTTGAALHIFFLAMTLHSEVVHKAQMELDAVVGPDRLPNTKDKDHLPYVDAVVKEVLRWHPVGPMGVPHCSVQDDVVHGYFIPKGAMILTNIWQYCHDEKYYHDPTLFQPERFLVGGTGKDGEPELDPRDVVFGFGRRACVGKELADSTLFIAIAMFLSVFNITKAVNSVNEKPIPPQCEFTSGIISHAKPFRCSIVPRSDRAERLIQAVEDEHPLDVSDAEDLRLVQWQ